MKQLFISILLLISISVVTIAQVTGVSTGTWFVKLTDYRFKQDGTATIFTKNPVKNYSQRLIVLNNSTYNYEEYVGNDTIKTTGTLAIIDDTLFFTLASSNKSKFIDPPTVKYYLYANDTSHLIYSIFPVVTRQEELDNRFEPVEVNASYKEGEHQFLKALYTSLATAQPVNSDTAYLNSYNLIISENGNFDITTLQEINARPEYLHLVKNALMNLKTNFIATKQNGRFVKGKMTFKVTY
jgi:hypothetical protein